jgi:hypothetical protein
MNGWGRFRSALIKLLAALLLQSGMADAQDVCIGPARIKSGPGERGYYATVSPTDAGGPERNHLSSLTCGVAELRRLGEYTRIETAKNLRSLDAVVTRKRDQILLLTYNQVTSLAPNTLKNRWSLPLPTSLGQEWDLPGALAVHANGLLYAVRGRILMAINPDEGGISTLSMLPPPDENFTIAYDGLTMLPDGNLLVKSLVQQRNGAPSRLLVLDPERLEVVSELVLPERIVPRVTVCTVRRQTYVYATGSSLLHRYRYADGRLTTDPTWGEVNPTTGAREMPYLRGERSPGGSAAGMGEWIVVQSNRTAAKEPLVLSAILQADPKQRFRFPPFGEDPVRAWSSLPLTADPENRRVYTASDGTGELVALDFDPVRGFSLAWAIKGQFVAPPILLGPPDDRIIVTTEREAEVLDPSVLYDFLVWREAKTSEEIRRSEPLPVGAGLPPVPAFGSTFYHLAPKQGHLSRVEFTHEAPPGGLFGSDPKKKKAGVKSLPRK